MGLAGRQTGHALHGHRLALPARQQAPLEAGLAAADGGTEVTWGFETDLGMNPVGRWMGLMMDSWIGADYEAGLARLKALVEGE